MLDLPGYFQRVRYRGGTNADLETLKALHLAHATHIPFENLDILLGRPIPLDLARVQAKLVGEERGGYCFEQNKLFAAVLRELGFSITPLAARVRPRPGVLLPRTHMCLRVRIDHSYWIADVGFGGEGLLLPVPMTGEVVQQFLWQYRLMEESSGVYVMQSLVNGHWHDMYALTLEPQEDVDFELANYYVSTHPESRFVRTLTVQLPTPERRQILRNREFITDAGDGIHTTVIGDDEDLLEALMKHFGLAFPRGTKFHFDDKTS